MIEIIDIPVQGSLEPFIVQGDTIDEIIVDSADFPDLTTSTIKLQLYFGTKKVFDVSNSDGITVNSATQCTIDQVEKEDNILPEGKLIGDFEITDVNGIRKSYFRFRYNIERQYTR